MKKSNVVKLVLVTSLFTACNSKPDKNTKDLYLRTDTIGEYSVMKVPQNRYIEFDSYDMLTSYYSFSNPMPGTYIHGYHSDALHLKSTSYGNHISRGGFGSSSFKAGG
jgi:hypothetical protein